MVERDCDHRLAKLLVQDSSRAPDSNSSNARPPRSGERRQLAQRRRSIPALIEPFSWAQAAYTSGRSAKLHARGSWPSGAHREQVDDEHERGRAALPRCRRRACRRPSPMESSACGLCRLSCPQHPRPSPESPCPFQKLELERGALDSTRPRTRPRSRTTPRRNARVTFFPAVASAPPPTTRSSTPRLERDVAYRLLDLWTFQAQRCPFPRVQGVLPSLAPFERRRRERIERDPEHDPIERPPGCDVTDDQNSLTVV